MHLIAVNIGKAEPFPTKSGQTGIFKKPQTGPVFVGELGLADDSIVDTDNHGGPDQAVYLYGQPDYDWWAKELGQELHPGQFGENLTLSGLESQKTLIGDRYRIGDVLLEVTSPRIPCATFAGVMGDNKWVKRFHAAERPGVYARVLETGSVSAGDEVELIPFSGEPVPAIAMMNGTRNPGADRMRWFLKAPVHSEMRTDYEAKLADLRNQETPPA